jgi:hypothetical protein
MKERNYKHIDGLLGEYISLLDEQIEIPFLLEKTTEKFKQHINDHNSAVYKPREKNEMFKIFTQIKKHEERRFEIETEIAEVEAYLKRFLSFLKGGKIAYEKKDDTDKSKITFLFWVENDKLMTNR